MTASTSRTLLDPPVRVLGPLVLAPGQRAPVAPERRSLLLAYLAVHAGEWVARERLAALFWPDRPSAEARRNLRKVLHLARASACAPRLEAAEQALRWSVDTDLSCLQTALETSRCDIVVGLRRGPLLQDLDEVSLPAWCEWLGAERERADTLWRQAVLTELRARGGTERRLQLACALLAVDPLDEDAVAALIEAETAAGRQSHARRGYEAYVRRLREALDIEPSRALRDLWLRVSAGAGVPLSGPALPDAGAAHAVSAPAEPAAGTGKFVGRRTELAELRQLLAAGCRLITVLGPGGVGKSRLALEALRTLAPAVGARPLWVDLIDLGTTVELWSRLAQGLGVHAATAADLEPAVAHALARQSWLLVLDNAEHLDGLASVIEPMSNAAPGLHLIVTSRTRLYARGEAVLPLGGLEVPDDESRDAEAASSFDAIRLFELRARAARSDFELERHLPAVIEIVEAVSGLPLAIELAAGWVPLMPPQRIADELRRSIDVLERNPGLETRPARPQHASVRAVLDQAWALLGAAERGALAALSVFRGGFTSLSARAVAGIALPLLSSLADKSLLGVAEDGRFTLHPLVAAYAAEQLASDPANHEHASLRHAEHFARELAALAVHATGDVRRLVGALTPEFANAGAAWVAAVAHRRSDLVADMVRALWAYFEVCNRQREGVQLLRGALSLPSADGDGALLRARLCHGLSMLHHRLGEHAEGLALARAGAGPAETCGDTEAFVGCVLNAGSCLWQMGDLGSARAAFERAVAIATERGDLQCLAWARGNLGVILAEAAEFDDALALYHSALAGSRAVGDQYNTGVHLLNMATTVRDTGRLHEAARVLSEAIDHAQTCGMPILALYGLVKRAQALLQAGDVSQAGDLFTAALQRASRAGTAALKRTAWLGLSQVAIRRREPELALAHLRTLVADARRCAAMSDLAHALIAHGDLLELQGDLAAAGLAWATVRACERLPPMLHRSADERLARVPETHRHVAALSFDAALDALLR